MYPTVKNVSLGCQGGESLILILRNLSSAGMCVTELKSTYISLDG